MRKFLIYFFVFIFPLVILGGVSEFFLRKIPNDYSYKKYYLDKHSKEVKILILGSSHTYFGVNPQFIKMNCFNAANVSQSLDYDLEILKKYKDNWDSLKYVIVPVDYFSLYERLHTSDEAWREKNYNIYFKIKIDNKLANNFEIISTKLNSNFHRLNYYYLKKISFISCSTLGWGINDSSDKNRDLLISGKEAAIRNTAKNDSCFSENVGFLKSILEFAKTKKINVILLTCPAYKSYVENLNKKQLNKTINIVTEISNGYANAKYYNFLNDKSFNKIDFFDGDHFNEIGAKKFTMILDSIINNEENTISRYKGIQSGLSSF